MLPSHKILKFSRHHCFARSWNFQNANIALSISYVQGVILIQLSSYNMFSNPWFWGGLESIYSLYILINLAMEVGGFNVLLCDKFNTFQVKLHDTTLQALYATHPCTKENVILTITLVLIENFLMQSCKVQMQKGWVGFLPVNPKKSWTIVQLAHLINCCHNWFDSIAQMVKTWAHMWLMFVVH